MSADFVPPVSVSVTFRLGMPPAERFGEAVRAALADAGGQVGALDLVDQINNLLCFPGLCRGLLDAGACEVDDSMKLAAARAIADIVGADELNPDYILPSPLDRAVVPAVAGAVMSAAEATGAVATPR